MAQPYTARQLDFFKSTLKTLESAIFDAALLATEAKSLQKIPATEIATIPVAEQEISDTKSSYFPVLPDPVVAPSIEQVATPVAVVTSLSNVKNSAAFFQALPWENGVSITHASNETSVVRNKLSWIDAEAVSVNVPLDNVQDSATFFRSLPWTSAIIKPLIADHVSHADVSPSHVSVIAPATESVALSPTIKTCATFFQSLPWDGTVHGSLASVTRSDDVIDAYPVIEEFDDDFVEPEIHIATPANQAVKNTCSTFFHAMPWQGQKQVVDATDIFGAMDSDDFTIIAGLATQSALSAAQRGSNQDPITTMPPTQRDTASGFFQTLPW